MQTAPERAGRRTSASRKSHSSAGATEGTGRAAVIAGRQIHLYHSSCLDGSSDKAIGSDQTAVKWASLLGSDPVRSRADTPGNLREAPCMGGVFAVRTVLPEKIQHPAAHLEDLRWIVPGELVEHSVQVLGCFLLLSVLISARNRELHPFRPLLECSPHRNERFAQACTRQPMSSGATSSARED